MKVCPVCQARAFDDASICYGCMYRFNDVLPDAQLAAGEAEWEPEEVSVKDCATGVQDVSLPVGRHVLLADETRGCDEEGAPQTRRGSRQPGATVDRSSPVKEALQLEHVSKEYPALPQQQGTEEALFDASGWVVRFELPGGAIPLGVSASGEQCAREEKRQHYSYEQEGAIGEKHACPLVISIAPLRGKDHREERAGLLENRGESAASTLTFSRAQVAS